MHSIKKPLTIIIAGIILLGLASCNENAKKVESNNTQVVQPKFKQEQSDKIFENTYNGECQQISRLRYIKGTIVSLKQSSEGKYILNLKVEYNYHNGTDPVSISDFPFKIGEVVEFTLKDNPQISLGNNEKIIIYQGQFTDGKNDFLGANIKYYEEKDKYFDMTGKEINLPPQDYPSSL